MGMVFQSSPLNTLREIEHYLILISCTGTDLFILTKIQIENPNKRHCMN